jgi:hypothetical protein
MMIAASSNLVLSVKRMTTTTSTEQDGSIAVTIQPNVLRRSVPFDGSKKAIVLVWQGPSVEMKLRW